MPPLHPLPVIPAAYYGQVRGMTNGTLPFANTFCWVTSVVPATVALDEANALHVATTLIGAWVAEMVPILPSQYTAHEAAIYPLGAPASPASVQILNGTGGVSSNLAPIKTAVLISESVHRRGKGSQSRTFVGPVPRDFVDITGEIFTDAAAWQTAWDNFNGSCKTVLDGLGLGTWTRSQLSRKGTGATYPILGSVVRSRFSTQRRRAGS